MDISKMTIEQLKAVKCDIYEAQAQNARDLDMINFRISELAKEQEKLTKKVAKEVIKK